MTAPRIMIMAGGTGGHVFPGLAVADELRDEGWSVSWLGTRDRMEAQLVPKSGYAIDFIDVAGIRGNGIWRLLSAPFKILKAVWQAWRIQSQLKPDVVLGMGGFASGPGGIAAWLHRIPLILHEQNAVSGMTNRILARFARRILQAFPNTFADSHRVTTVGNPIRRALAADGGATKSEDEKVHLLVIGGSLGAQVFNSDLPPILASMPEAEKVSVWHQTGQGKRESTEEAYGKQGLTVKLTEFIVDMAAAYRWADIVICRAGALTVSELAIVGKPAIFVPLPHAVDDHQTKNAESLVQADAARLVPQHQMNGGLMLQTLRELINSAQLLEQMQVNAKAQGRPDATAAVSRICKELAGGVS